MKKYWTLEKCQKDAKKHKTKKEWRENSGSAYTIASRNNWLNECCSHMIEIKKPNGYWTLKRCQEDTKKYKTKTEWSNKSPGAYKRAQINKWLEACCVHM